MSIPLPALPEDNMQICLTLPNSPEWRQIYMGALQIMAQWWYWQVSSPIDAEDVIQRVMECSAITGSSYEGCMILDCQEIIDCINSTPELRQLISKLGSGYPVPLDQTPISSISDMSMISDNTGCDNDRLFGAITGLVDLMNAIAEDFLERLQDQANTVSRIAELIEVIPGVGELVPADLVTLAENFLEDLLNLYQSEYTVALRDKYRCDLFCLYKDDCNFSIEEAMEYFAEQITEGINIVDFGSFIGQYILGEFTGPSLVASWNVLILGMLQFGSEVLDINADQMVLMVSAMFNDPDSDWTILCDECPEPWEHLIDFELAPYPHTVVNFDDAYPSTWVLGQGYTAGRDAGGARGGTGFVLPIEADLTYTEVVFDLVNTATNTRGVGIRLFSQVVSPWTGALGELIDIPQGSDSNKDYEYTADIEGVNTVMAFTGSRQGAGSKCTIKRMLLRGNGVNPFL